MKLPWNDDNRERIEQLEKRIEELEEERDSFRERFEAEKERRSELARKKQEAEEELNRLRDRLESLKDANGADEEVEGEGIEDVTELSFQGGYRLLQKLDSFESSEKDLVTVFSPGNLEDIEDLKGLRNTLNQQQLQRVQGKESFVALFDPDIYELVLKTRPFFGSGWVLSDEFSVERLLDFIEEKKIWVLVSAGETHVYEEESGNYEEVEVVKSRVNRQHGKGGYSQDRFERKREEQIEQHLDEVEGVLEDKDNIYLLGGKDLCNELPGERLGGFDPNTSPPEVFYSFQLIR